MNVVWYIIWYQISYDISLYGFHLFPVWVCRWEC
jgi:hypothetical protein